MYQQFNENPGCKTYKRGKKKGKKEVKGDCVIRAMMLLWKTDWLTAYKRLCKRGEEVYNLPNSNEVYTTFLSPTGIDAKIDNGFRKRYKTVKEFAEETKGTRTGYIVRCQHHLVFIKNGKYYDAWDSGLETVRKIWKEK